MHDVHAFVDAAAGATSADEVILVDSVRDLR